MTNPSSAPVDHAAAAGEFVADRERTAWHDAALWHVRVKRDRAVAAVPEWEALRDRAAAIKRHTLSHLDEYLVEFEANALRNGMTVHWARDAEEHNAIVLGILRERGIRQLVKSKSMLTEECGLNPHLEQNGVEVVDTDLGEWIVQQAHEAPSHIVMPAIHKKREEVGVLFHEVLGTEEGSADADYLTAAARAHLRKTFLGATAALTGVNFAVAETGGFVVCTNEGNADFGVHVAPLHIACMGIEKLIPRLVDLGVFIRLLARSATGQPITTYTSHFHAPRAGGELHVVIVDNGRSRQLGREQFRDSLACIRCGACLNTCPVYRRSGGHSYGSTIPGPIGAILSPGIDLKRYASLPFASTLCGSCSDVCPVKIDIHGQLYAWRQEVGGARAPRWSVGALERWSVGAAERTLASPRRYRAAGRWARRMLRVLPRALTSSRFNVWARQRELPDPPDESFGEWYRRTHK